MTKTALNILGVVFLLVGLLGFFNNPILGFFAVNNLHNGVHLVSGILALVFAMQSESSARMFAKVFGVIYLLVGVLGFLAPDLMKNLLSINTMDNFLHLLLGVVFILIGMSKAHNSAVGSNM